MKGVTIEDGEVVEINWDERELTGTLHLEWLPPSVRKFNGSMSRLTGTVDLASLPIAMTQLELGLNALAGSKARESSRGDNKFLRLIQQILRKY